MHKAKKKNIFENTLKGTDYSRHTLPFKIFRETGVKLQFLYTLLI